MSAMTFRFRGRWLRSSPCVLWLLVAPLLVACASRPGAVGAGVVRGPGGGRLADEVFEGLSGQRRTTSLPPVLRRHELDERAVTGLQVVLAGLPEVDPVDHVARTVGLADGLEYAVGFASETPGLDEATRRAGTRLHDNLHQSLLAADPSLDGIGWAAAGPWAVFVLQFRPVRPADAPAIEVAARAALAEERPALQADAALDRLAANAVADGQLTTDDEVRLARAGGVPVRLVHEQGGAHRVTSTLNWALSHDGPGTLHEAWLRRFGVAALVTDQGDVLSVVVATGEANRAEVADSIMAAEPKMAELMAEVRTTDGLPGLRLDPRLAGSARRALAEAIGLGCFAGDPGCPAPDPGDADLWYSRERAWYSPEDAFTWRLDPFAGDDLRLKRFGAAAAIGPDGAVWSLLLLAS